MTILLSCWMTTLNAKLTLLAMLLLEIYFFQFFTDCGLFHYLQFIITNYGGMIRHILSLKKQQASAKSLWAGLVVTTAFIICMGICLTKTHKYCSLSQLLYTVRSPRCCFSNNPRVVGIQSAMGDKYTQGSLHRPSTKLQSCLLTYGQNG